MGCKDFKAKNADLWKEAKILNDLDKKRVQVSTIELRPKIEVIRERL